MALRIQAPPYPENIFENLSSLIHLEKNGEWRKKLFKLQLRLWRLRHYGSLRILWKTSTITNELVSRIFTDSWNQLGEKNQGALLALLYSNQCLISSLRSIEECRLTSSSVALRSILENSLWAKALLELDHNTSKVKLKGSTSNDVINKTSNRIPGCKRHIEMLSKYLQHSKFHTYVFTSGSESVKINVSRNVIPADNLIYCDWRYTLALTLKTAYIYTKIIQLILDEHPNLSIANIDHYQRKLIQLEVASGQAESKVKRRADDWLQKLGGKHASEIE